MRILIIAPSDTGLVFLDTIPEVQAIQERHTTFVLSGKDTTYDRVLEAARRWPCDAIHIAGHSTPDDVPLSNGEKLRAEDLALICRLTKASLIVFNSCNSGKLASYCVRHGPFFAFFANVELTDAQAWRFALGFYNSIANGNSGNILGAYRVAAMDDGLIGWTMNPEIAAPALQAGYYRTGVIPTRMLIAVAVLTVLAVVLSVLAFYNSVTPHPSDSNLTDSNLSFLAVAYGI